MSNDEGRNVINTAAEFLEAAAQAGAAQEAAEGVDEDFAAVERTERSMTKLAAYYSDTLERVVASFPRMGLPSLSLGRLEGFAELQEVMEAYERWWQSPARPIGPPSVRSGLDPSAIAASIRPLPRAATREEVAALEQDIVALRLELSAEKMERRALEQRLSAVEMQRVFPSDADFRH